MIIKEREGGLQIAGDIGIAPMLPWIYAIMSNPKDYTQVEPLLH